MTDFNFFKINRIYNELFYQFPKVLITSDKYKTLSDSSKIAYMLLKSRLEFAVKKNQIDENNNVYFTFTISELCDVLNCQKQKAISIKNQLEKHGLLFQMQMGFNKNLGKNNPNRLYLAELEVTENDIYEMASIDHQIIENIEKSEGMKITHSPETKLSKKSVVKQDSMKITHSNKAVKSEGMKIIHELNNLKQDTLKEDTKKTDTREQQQETYLLNHFAETHEEHSFLNRQNLELIGLFSDTLVDAENMQGIILRAKKDVEKKQEAVLILDDGYLHDETLAIQEDIRKTLHRIYQKRKTDSSIKNIDNYTYGAFKNLFEQKLGEWKMLTGETQNTISMHDWVK